MIRRRDPSGTQILVATGTGAQAACADLDDDGVAGFTRLAVEFRDVETGKRVPVELTTTGPDMGTDGSYRVTLQVGDERVEGDVRARVSLWPDRPPRRS